MHVKKVIHTLKTKLATDHNISIKNSHLYELIASWHGYKSKASMDVSGCFGQDEFDYFEENKDLVLFFSRGQNLGYSADELTELNNEIVIILEQLNIIFIDYEDLTLDEPNYKEGYWYRKKQDGIKLSSSQTQFADEYEQSLSTFDKNKNHLVNAANSGSSSAALTLAEYYEDKQGSEDANSDALKWYKVAEKLGAIDAKSILAIQYEESQYLVEAAEYGDVDCIDKVAREENSPERIHYWYELAKLYDYDITKSTAVQDGGNWFVDYEGIYLPVISAPKKSEAEKEAKATFDKYQKANFINQSN